MGGDPPLKNGCQGSPRTKRKEDQRSADRGFKSDVPFASERRLFLEGVWLLWGEEGKRFQKII